MGIRPWGATQQRQHAHMHRAQPGAGPRPAPSARAARALSQRRSRSALPRPPPGIAIRMRCPARLGTQIFHAAHGAQLKYNFEPPARAPEHTDPGSSPASTRGRARIATPHLHAHRGPSATRHTLGTGRGPSRHTQKRTATGLCGCAERGPTGKKERRGLRTRRALRRRRPRSCRPAASAGPHGP